MKSLNIGDFIQCHDKTDMVDTMMELAENGYDTDFVYQRDGKKGYWLKVEDYTADTYQKAFKYALESFSLFAEELKYEYEDYEVDFEQAKDSEQQIAALQQMCICQGKMKMLNDIRCLMTEMKGESEVTVENINLQPEKVQEMFGEKARVTQLEGQYLDTGITQGIV